MPRERQPAKQLPPNTTKSTASTRNMRASTKGVEPTGAEAGSSSRTQKRKAKNSQPVDQPAKRPNRKSSKDKNTCPLVDAQEPVEPTPGKNTETVGQGIVATTRASKVAGRKVPVRPPFSSDSEDGEEEPQNQTTDGDATSPVPSEDEMDKVLSATQLTKEYPVTVPNGGKRVERLIREIPIPGPSFQQPDYSLGKNIPDRGAKSTVQDIHPPANHFPNPTDHKQSIPSWPAFTELAQAEDGSYKQTGQTIEINNCLSTAVKRANANLVLNDSFPDTEDQEQWLSDALRFALSAGNQSHVINMVGERARVDIKYFNCLLSMIRNRWSGYRQSALNVARDLVCPKEKPSERKSKAKAKKDARKSLYKLTGSDAEKAVAAAKLLDCDAFHFARTNTDEPDARAPYQHQAMLVMLGYFFKCDKSLKDRVPTGEHGPEVPIPMVALATTLQRNWQLEVALTEVAEGDRMRFSEEMQQERYFGHLNSFEQVKLSKNGNAKLARLLSTVYEGTMKESLSKGSGGAAPSISTRPTYVNADLLPA
ncbi:hypothetical protein BJ322DRAFT_1015835 [Thelephora terrestris]|uniref:DUF6532 domain-containing protein n=1 Tax=Thelephora terrestris TaxID=56493 RepID=A0A9P6HNJ7_9AGAM|nr:hypothetical protein BJ322DRAFT_1015835 [Thelephora terrestris]